MNRRVRQVDKDRSDGIPAGAGIMRGFDLYGARQVGADMRCAERTKTFAGRLVGNRFSIWADLHDAHSRAGANDDGFTSVGRLVGPRSRGMSRICNRGERQDGVEQ